MISLLFSQSPSSRLTLSCTRWPATVAAAAAVAGVVAVAVAAAAEEAAVAVGIPGIDGMSSSNHDRVDWRQ